MSLLFQRLKWIITGFNKSAPVNPKRLDGPDVKPLPSPMESEGLKPDHKLSKQLMLEVSNEISIYIHRFHNLDLFQQGWYQLQITLRWEDSDFGVGIPARVVQYEAPDLGSDDVIGVWRIDDTDHSFSTPPFRIRYARQDILLAMMVSFTLPLRKLEGISTSAVILKFELLYTPVLENRSNVQASLDTSPAAVHEFRLPPKALLGLHAYCPVYFDAFHSVLVDTSVHVSLLKRRAYAAPLKVSSDPKSDGGGTNTSNDKAKLVMAVKALSSARDILAEELQKLSNAINKPIDIKDVTSNELFGFTASSNKNIVVNGEVPVQKTNGEADMLKDDGLHSLPENKLISAFDLIGNQVFYLWSIFLNFHRFINAH